MGDSSQEGPPTSPRTAPSRPRRKANKPAKSLVNNVAWQVAASILVLFNFVYVGIEVDYYHRAGEFSGIMDILRVALAILNLLQATIEALLSNPYYIFCQWHHVADLVIVILSFADAVSNFTGSYLLWHYVCLRIVRYLHLWSHVRTSLLFRDLWVVLVGIYKGMRTLIFLVILLFVVLFVLGTLFRALVVDGDSEDLCIGSDFRVRAECLDEDEYFGSIPKSMFTAFQVITLDRWAANVVRPLLHKDKTLAAVVITIFTFITAYALLSVVIGVFVWSTVEVASGHLDHESQRALIQDRATIKKLRQYYEAELLLDDRYMLDLVTLQDSIQVREIAAAFKSLQLPVQNVKQLFDHIDRDQRGEVKLEQFEAALLNLKEPASRMDFAILAATLGGHASWAKHLEIRSETLRDRVRGVSDHIMEAFHNLNQVAEGDDINAWMPEIGVRKSGGTAMAPPPSRFQIH